jgi:glycosyltransferase involved in cell wall biosynthesis
MKISVCLATYNGEKFIKKQIDSILKQLSATDELIISDDGSTDNSLSIISSYQDPRIRFLTNKNKKDIARNFENALKNATGDYIFLSDQDDIWLDNKVQVITKELQTANCILHNAHLIDCDGEFLNKDLFSIYGTRKGYWNNIIRNTYVGCCMAFRKELIPSILPIPASITMHDMWIALIAERKGETKILDNNLMFYRRHDNNASTTSSKSEFSRLYQLKYRLHMLYFTLTR